MDDEAIYQGLIKLSAVDGHIVLVYTLSVTYLFKRGLKW
jgi:hypothetical protein